MNQMRNVYLEFAQVESASKGQITIEFLLLFAIFLSLLVIFVPVIMDAYVGSKALVLRHTKEKIATQLEGEINKLCILGEKNVRYVYISFPLEVRINASGNTIDVGGILRESTCEVFGDIFIQSGKIKLENRDGKIYIETN